MTAIDMHSHIVLPEVVAALPAQTRAPGDVDALIAAMDENGVRISVLSNQVAEVTNQPAAVSVPLCRTFNDAASAACARFPDRLAAFAALPAADIAAAVAELERAMTLPGIIGAFLPLDGFLSLQRARRFAPLLAAADRHRAILLAHYGTLPDDPEAPHPDLSDNRSRRTSTLDMQSRISSAMVTFCFTELLDAYPNLTMMTHNLGGNIPYEIERMDHRAMISDAAGTPLPSKVIRGARVFVDCNSMGPRSIERAVEVYGSERIMFGSDGTAFGMRWTQHALDEARITDADREAIRHRNAAAALARVSNRVAVA